MPRKKKTLEDLEAQPLERKPRSRKKAPAQVAEAVEQIPTVTVAAELPRRLIDELPRPRQQGDERASYTSRNVRVLKEPDAVYIEVYKPLAPEMTTRLIDGGFDDISEEQDGSKWRAWMRDLRDARCDPNVLAVVLDGKGQRLGWEQGR